MVAVELLRAECGHLIYTRLVCIHLSLSSDRYCPQLKKARHHKLTELLGKGRHNAEFALCCHGCLQVDEVLQIASWHTLDE